MLLALRPKLETWVSVGVGGASLLFGASQDRRAKKREAETAALTSQVEAARERRIGDAQAQIDRVYDSPARAQQLQTYATALRGHYGQQLGQRRADESRNLKFALAKAGQTGGSVAVDSGRRLQQEFYDAALDRERSVQSSVARLKAQDEASRASLRAQAASGLGVTQAATRALQTQSSSIAGANAEARGAGLGDVFGQTAATYRAINERAALQRGLGYNARRNDLYGRVA